MNEVDGRRVGGGQLRLEAIQPFEVEGAGQGAAREPERRVDVSGEGREAQGRVLRALSGETGEDLVDEQLDGAVRRGGVPQDVFDVPAAAPGDGEEQILLEAPEGGLERDDELEGRHATGLEPASPEALQSAPERRAALASTQLGGRDRANLHPLRPRPAVLLPEARTQPLRDVLARHPLGLLSQAQSIEAGGAEIGLDPEEARAPSLGCGALDERPGHLPLARSGSDRRTRGDPRPPRVDVPDAGVRSVQEPAIAGLEDLPGARLATMGEQELTDVVGECAATSGVWGDAAHGARMVGRGEPRGTRQRTAVEQAERARPG